MKLSCEIVQDLLPLYEDNICSEASREAVEAHLKECPACRELLQSKIMITEPEIKVQTSVENRAVVRSFRKIRRRWAASLIAVLLIIPLVILTVNEVRNEGVCYTNIDEIMLAGNFMRALDKQDFEKAAEAIDYKKMYADMQEMLAMSVDDFKPDFIPVTIGESEWMMEEEIYEQYQYDLGDEKGFWTHIIFEYSPFMIPADIWDAIVSELPEEFIIDGKETLLAIELESFAEPYVRMETKWGDFMVRKSWSLDDEPASDYCVTYGLVPARLYQEAEEEFETSAQEQYQYIQERYSDFADMTVEEFSNAMKAKNKQKLSEGSKKGLIFENTGYKGSSRYRRDGYWTVTYDMNVHYKGNTYPLILSLNILDGKILSLGMSSENGFPEDEIMNVIRDVLHMNYVR